VFANRPRNRPRPTWSLVSTTELVSNQICTKIDNPNSLLRFTGNTPARILLHEFAASVVKVSPLVHLARYDFEMIFHVLNVETYPRSGAKVNQLQSS
jgi:hypothetical protein